MKNIKKPFWGQGFRLFGISLTYIPKIIISFIYISYMKNYSLKSRILLALYGNQPISHIILKRVAKVDNFNVVNRQYHRISPQEIKALPYDSLFKLYFEIHMKNGKIIHLSKNKIKTIPLSQSGSLFIGRIYDMMDIPITKHTITMKQLINTTRENMGDDFHEISAHNNNQAFILNIITSNLLCEYTNNLIIFAGESVSDLFTHTTRKIQRQYSLRISK